MDNKFNNLINYIDDVSNQNKVKKKKNPLSKFLRAIISIFSITFLVGSGYFIKVAIDNNKDFNESKSIIRELTNTNSINFDELKTKNSDTVAWIKVPNTLINYPVVQRGDNKFYLKNDFYKKQNIYGWIFADFRDEFPILSQNTIIYGHNTSIGIMFGDLINLLDKKWYENEENKYIYLTTTEKEYKFEIFSVYKINTTNDYIKTEFSNDFNEYIQMVSGRSFIDFNTKVENEKIITLSTCYNTQNSSVKLVVHAKMINI